MKIKLNRKEYEVNELVRKGDKYIPVLNIKMMSDEMWNELAKRKSPL